MHMNWPVHVTAMDMAHGTNMAVMSPTSLRRVTYHNAPGNKRDGKNHSNHHR
jgi:hypothetical protein